MKNRLEQPEMSDARQQGYFNIGEASQESGVSTKMIRHYEQIGLIPEANRTFSNYRIYNMTSIHTLRFIKKARELGFPIKKIERLLGLYQDRQRSSADVKKLALEHIRELDEKIRELEQMRNMLGQLATHCHGDRRPECPILEGMSRK